MCVTNAFHPWYYFVRGVTGKRGQVLGVDRKVRTSIRSGPESTGSTWPCYLVVEIYYRLSLYDPSQVSFRLSQLPVHKSREQILQLQKCLFIELLKLFTLLTSTTLSGNEFQWSTTLCEKLYFLLFILHCFLNILCLWPLVFVFLIGNMLVQSTLSTLLMILYVSTRSDLILLYWRVGRPKFLSLSPQVLYLFNKSSGSPLYIFY